MSKSYRDISRNNYFPEKPTEEHVKLGGLQRIADSLEAMAKPFVQAIQDAEFHRKKSERLSDENQNLRNRIAGHKAAYTKLKNKYEALKRQSEREENL